MNLRRETFFRRRNGRNGQGRGQGHSASYIASQTPPENVFFHLALGGTVSSYANEHGVSFEQIPMRLEYLCGNTRIVESTLIHFKGLSRLIVTYRGNAFDCFLLLYFRQKNAIESKDKWLFFD